jgi:hypothetical protein
MNLINYQSIHPKKDLNKAIRTDEAGTSTNTKLVLGSNSYKDNYGFLFFLVDPLKTADDDYYYVVHAQSGYVVAPKKESQKDGDDLVLTRFDGSPDQQWSFLNFDEYGNANIVSRSTGYVWKVKGGKTGNGTDIVVHTPSGNSNSYWAFYDQPTSEDPSIYKTIPHPELAGLIDNTGQTLDDESLIPKPTGDNSTYKQTAPVLIGECSIPFCTFDVYLESSSTSDPNSMTDNLEDQLTFANQVKETPYYVFRRYQYWTDVKDGMIKIPVNEPYHEDFEYTYGATDSQLSKFSSQTDWELESDLTISYGPASTGMSGAIKQATLIDIASSGIEYHEEEAAIPINLDAASYERVLYVWQIVDQLQLLNGDGVLISSIEMPGKATYITEYDSK